MTPICPHTLSNRSIIFREGVKLQVFNRSPDSRLLVAVDGQRNLASAPMRRCAFPSPSSAWRSSSSWTTPLRGRAREIEMERRRGREAESRPAAGAARTAASGPDNQLEPPVRRQVTAREAGEIGPRHRVDAAGVVLPVVGRLALHSVQARVEGAGGVGLQALPPGGLQAGLAAVELGPPPTPPACTRAISASISATTSASLPGCVPAKKQNIAASRPLTRAERTK